jgi:Fe-S-cluster containining protein
MAIIGNTFIKNGDLRLPGSYTGCPFRGEKGCRVYPVRPFMCRLFGFHFAHPYFRSQPYCPKAEMFRPGDDEARLFQRYRDYCDEHGFVLIGRPSEEKWVDAALEDNRAAISANPWLRQLATILTGGDQCFPGDGKFVV